MELQTGPELENREDLFSCKVIWAKCPAATAAAGTASRSMSVLERYLDRDDDSDEERRR